MAASENSDVCPTLRSWTKRKKPARLGLDRIDWAIIPIYALPLNKSGGHLFKIPDGCLWLSFLLWLVRVLRLLGCFAPAGATRAVCPGPDRLREGGRSFFYALGLCLSLLCARPLALYYIPTLNKHKERTVSVYVLCVSENRSLTL